MLVSIIIPCHNVEKYIGECINSVLNQTYSHIEIICVDDGSSDGTKNILNDYQNKFPEKIFFFFQSNQGAPFARNKGLSVAKGKWIQFLDADDLLLPEKIHRQVKMINQSNQQVDFIAAAFSRRFFEGTEKTILPEKNFWKGLFSSQLGITSSNLFGASALHTINGWNENLKGSQEYELMFRLLKNGFHCIHDFESHTLIRERKTGSLSQSNLNLYWKNYIHLRLEMIEYFKKEKIFNGELKEFSLQYLFDCIRTLYKYDKESAKKYHQIIMEENFSPQISKATTKSYLFFYKRFGFPIAENMSYVFKKITK